MVAIKTVACLVNRASPLFMDFSIAGHDQQALLCLSWPGWWGKWRERGREGTERESSCCLVPLHLPPNCQQFSFILRNLHMPCSLACLTAYFAYVGNPGNDSPWVDNARTVCSVCRLFMAFVFRGKLFINAASKRCSRWRAEGEGGLKRGEV